LRDIVVPLEIQPDGADHEYALLGSYLLRISRGTDEVQIWHGGNWQGFALTGTEVRALEETVLLTAPALNSLVN
jgi:hypothetical protein